MFRYAVRSMNFWASTDMRLTISPKLKRKAHINYNIEYSPAVLSSHNMIEIVRTLGVKYGYSQNIFSIG